MDQNYSDSVRMVKCGSSSAGFIFRSSVDLDLCTDLKKEKEFEKKNENWTYKVK